MRSLRSLGLSLFGALALASGVSTAEAGFLLPIPGPFATPPSGGGLILIPPLTPSFNNDPGMTDPMNIEIGTDNGLLVLPKIFLPTWQPGGYIDIPLVAVRSFGTTEYVLIETVLNLTYYDWHDYHFEIGMRAPDGSLIHIPGLDFDTGADITGQYLELIGQALHGDDPNYPDIYDPFFALTGLDPFTLDFKALGPDMPNHRAVTFGIVFDVPDITPALVASLGLPADQVSCGRFSCSGYHFVIRQYPTIPEPMSLALLGTGLAGIGAMRRRRTAR